MFLHCPLLFKSLLSGRYALVVTFCYNGFMQKLIVFNWKENPQTVREAKQIFAVATRATTHSRNKNKVVICPPSMYLGSFFSEKNRGSVLLGAQNVFWENEGAYTGEIGSGMLMKLGVRYVVVGHSERRRHLHETDEMVNKKVCASLASGLRVILCVGEPLAVRKKGIVAAKRYVKEQLKKDLKNIRNSKLDIRNLVIAYEPIWAIGTGKNATSEDAREMAVFIKDEASSLLRSPKGTSSLRILYGGSVSGKNVIDYVSCNEIDGVLVGGASLKAKEVRKIISNI